MPWTSPPTPPKIPAFDPATAGWEVYGGDDEGFIGLIGPWWMRKDGDSYLYAFLADRSTTTAAAWSRAAC